MDEIEVEVDDGETVWRFDRTFLSSNWTCIWGRGCLGILDEPAEHLAQGCCSVGAELGDEEEARNIDALAATLGPERFEHHAEATASGIFSDALRTQTRIVDGACIFLNRPGFEGGAGCALHLEALASDESPIDWKPSVCWQLPIKVDWDEGDDGREVATVRAGHAPIGARRARRWRGAVPRAPGRTSVIDLWSIRSPPSCRRSSVRTCTSRFAAACARSSRTLACLTRTSPSLT